MSRRAHYIAAENDALYLHALRNRFLRTPNVSVTRINPDTPEDFAAVPGPVDSVLCLNVLEYVKDPAVTLRAINQTLAPGGLLLVLVPQGRKLFGSVDRTLGHKRRFEASELRSLLGDAGFETIQAYQLNKIGRPAWWFYSRILERSHISKIALKLFDKTVWIWRRVDVFLPWQGLSLIAIARRVDAQ
jgi:SAM-dependent methyltransferase